MIEDATQPSSQPENLQTPPSANSFLPPIRKSNKNVWILVSLAVIFVCFSIVVCMAVFGFSLFKINAERSPVEVVLSAYMQHMANKDADSAFALFSPRAQRQIPISKVEEMLEGNNYFLFEGYQNLTVTNLNISAVSNTNPDLPQGTVAKVTGVVIFEGDIQGTFNGVLEKVDRNWMIDGIYVTVPPSKVH